MPIIGRVLCAVLVLCTSRTIGGDGESRAPSDASVTVDMLSLMRGGARASGLGQWRTHGHIAVTAVTAAGGEHDAVIITCTAPAGCSPRGSDGNITVHEADGHQGLHGLFMENITLPPSADFLLQALARARLRVQPLIEDGKIIDAYALVCPYVGAFTRATVGRGGDHDLLVGNCQAPLPAEEPAGLEARGQTLGPARGGRLLSASAFSSTAKRRSQYTVGLFFGPTSQLGDSFLLFDLRVLRPLRPQPAQHLIPATGPDGLLPQGDESPEAGRVGPGWAGWGPSQRPLLHCPRHLLVKDGQWGVQVLRKYDRLVERLGPARPLHFYSYYGNTTPSQWDHLVRRHVGGLGYRPGHRVFEAGCAAGAFLDSIARQFGVEVAGVDFAGALIRVAQRRVPGSFCAADAGNLSFVPDEAFDHAVAFGVLTYVNEAAQACSMAHELLRVTRPGGTVLLAQINDPDLAISRARPARMEGVSSPYRPRSLSDAWRAWLEQRARTCDVLWCCAAVLLGTARRDHAVLLRVPITEHRPSPRREAQGLGVPPHYWYKFALEEGVDVSVARGEEVYSKVPRSACAPRKTPRCSCCHCPRCSCCRCPRCSCCRCPRASPWRFVFKGRRRSG